MRASGLLPVPHPADASEPRSNERDAGGRPRIRAATDKRSLARRSSAPGTLRRSFAEVPVSIAIHDDDDDRAAQTQALLRRLASQLGLSPDRIVIDVGPMAAARTRARGAQGLIDGGVVHLDPAAYDPATHDGRRLLAHEVAHVAQQQLSSSSTTLRNDSQLALTEAEAEALAVEFASTALVSPVRVPLARHLVAARAPAEMQPNALIATVRASRSDEIARIVSLLSYGPFDWAIRDGDVAEVLHILAMAPMLTARAIAAAIGPKYRRRLFENLKKDHYGMRTEILAVAWAKEQSESWHGIEHKLLLPMDFTLVDDIETVAIDFVVQHLSENGRRALMADGRRAARINEIQDWARSAAGEAAFSAEFEQAEKEEQATADARKIVDVTLGGLAADIHETLKKLVVRDRDALRLLDRIAAECLTTRDPTQKFQALANALGNAVGGSDLDKLIDQIPVAGLYRSDRRRKTFVYLVSMRSPFKNAQLAMRLLDAPWWKVWDWSVSSEEAFLAFLLVKSMPARARSAFFRAHDGKDWWWEDEILLQLPVNILESDTFNLYTGGPDHKDEQSILEQLMDPSLWTREKKDKLDAVIRMARAAGHAEYVFEQSKLRNAFHRDKGLVDIVTKYELYDPVVNRYTYSERALEGHHWYEEGIASYIGILAASIDFIRKSDNVDLGTFAIGGEGLNLAELQDITGGSLIGARFRRPTARDRQMSRNRGELPPNFANARFNMHRGRIDVSIPSIELEKLSYPLEDLRISAGPSTAKSVTFSARYHADEEQLQSMHLGVEQLLLHDLLFTLPQSMLAVNHAHVTNLRVVIEVSEKSAIDTSPSGPEVSTAWLANVLGLLGSGVTNLAGALKSVGLPKELIITFDSAELRGVATSGGQFIERIDIGSTAMHAGGDAASYRRALRESAKRLERRLAQENTLLNRALGRAREPEETTRRQKAVDRLRRQLDGIYRELTAGQPAGSVLDVGAITATGVEGWTDKPIELTDIHGQGRSVTGLIPLISDSKRLRNILSGEGSLITLSARTSDEEQFTVDVGTVTADDVRIAKAIPTPDDAKADLDTFVNQYDPESRTDFTETAAALATRLHYARTYADLRARGWQNLEPSESLAASEAQRWLLAFERSRAAVIGSVSLEGAALTIDPRGRGGIRTDALLVQNVRTFTPHGDPDLTIGQISGTDVDVGGVLHTAASGRVARADVKAKRLSISDVRKRGLGAIEELTLEGDDDTRLEAFVETSKQGPIGLGLQSRRIIARGLSMPVHAGLLRTELARLKQLPGRRPDQQKRLDTVEAMLADLDRIRSSVERAEQILARATSKSARTVATRNIADAKRALVDWEQRLVVQQLSIEDLNVALTATADLGAAGEEFSVSAGAGAKEWFKKAEIEGVRTRTEAGEQVVANKLGFGATRGTVAKTETGFRLSGFGIAAVRAQGVSYASSAVSVACAGETTLIDVEIDGEVARKADGQHVTISRLAIASLYADRLSYEDRDKTVGVRWGVLQGVLVEGLSIVLPSDPTAAASVDGNVSLEQVNTLMVDAAVAGHRVSASLTSAEPQPGTRVKALSARVARSGDAEVSLEGLTAAATITRTRTSPDPSRPGRSDRIAVVAKDLSGTVARSGDNYSVRNLSLGELTVSNSSWRAGNKTIDIFDRVTLTGISVDAEASLRARPAKAGAAAAAQPEKELSRLVLTRVAVADIDARKVVVGLDAVEAVPARGIGASSAQSLTLERAHIVGLSLTGFDVLNTRGTIEITQSVTVTNLKATIGEIAKGQLARATVSLTAHGRRAKEPAMGGRELSATLRGSDGTIIRLGRIQEVLVSDADSRKVRIGDPNQYPTEIATLERAAVKGVTSGDLVIKGNTVSISDLEIDSVDVGPSHFGTATPLSTIQFSSASIPNKLRIQGISATFKKVPAAKGKPETEQLDEITIEGVAADRIVMDDFLYSGPSGGSSRPTKRATVAIAKATLLGLQLRHLSRDFTRNLLIVQGGLESVTVGRFLASLSETVGNRTTQTRIFANLRATDLNVLAILGTVKTPTGEEKFDFGGGLTIGRVGIRGLDIRFKETGLETKKINLASHQQPPAGEEAGIDVEGLSVGASGISVGSVKGHSLVYTDPNIGLTLDIMSAKIPEGVTMPAHEPYKLPYAVINEAYFEIDDVRKLAAPRRTPGGGDSKGGGGKPGEWIRYLDVLDHLNGSIYAELYVPIRLTGAPFGGEFGLEPTFPVTLTITDGKFDYNEAEDKSLPHIYDAALDFKMYHGLLMLHIGPDVLTFWESDSDLERDEMERGLVRVKRIALPWSVRRKMRGLESEEERKEREQKEKEGKGEEDPPHVDPQTIEVRNLRANLGLKGYIPVDIPNGRIALGTQSADAMTALTLTKQSSDRLTWSLLQLNATVEELNIAGGALTGGEISITGVRDASLDFVHSLVMQPRKLQGTITQATVRNLTFEPQKKAGP